MVEVPRPPPTAERKREYEKARKAWSALVPDPVAAMEEAAAKPLRFAINDGPKLYKGELWLRRKKRDGSRPEGKISRDVWRDPVTKQFAKIPARAKGKKKKPGREL